MVPDLVSVNQLSTHRWSLFQDLVKISGAGFNSIGLCNNKLEEFGLVETADLLFEMQMNVTSLSWMTGFTGSTGVSHTDSIDEAIQAIRSASLLGAHTLAICVGGRNGHADGHLQRLVHQALDELVPLAEDLDVRLAVEPVCGPEFKRFNFAGEMASTLKLIRDYPLEHVGVVADLFFLGGDMAAARDISRYLDRIALVQLCDVSHGAHGKRLRCLPGAGQLPLAAWINMLSHYNYHGPVEMELHGPEFDFVSHEDMLVASREFVARHFSPVVFEEVKGSDPIQGSPKTGARKKTSL